MVTRFLYKHYLTFIEMYGIKTDWQFDWTSAVFTFYAYCASFDKGRAEKFNVSRVRAVSTTDLKHSRENIIIYL